MAAEKVTDEDLDLLDELGVDVEPQEKGGRSPRVQRIIAGFEEIERFFSEHGRLPQHGEGRDIFERLYAVRLDRLRASEECRAVLKDFDRHELLTGAEHVEDVSVEGEMDDAALLASLGVEASTSDITQIKHVRTQERKATEEVAQRKPCIDFDQFRSTFEQAQKDLASGRRLTAKFTQDGTLQPGDMFILDGQKVLVAGWGEVMIKEFGREDRRLRVIFDNGTESNLLLRSLYRALYKYEHVRRILPPDAEGMPLFADQVDEEDTQVGSIYVLRSLSDHPFVVQHRELIHKIGVTGGEVKSRLANAGKDPTYLLADVEIVAEY